MSYEVFLVRFNSDIGTCCRPKEVATEVIRNAIDSVLRAHGKTRAGIMSNDGKSVLVHLPGGTAEVHAEWARIPVDNVDVGTSDLIWEIASVANMVILPNGETSQLTLVDDCQRESIPSAILDEADELGVASTPGALHSMLTKWVNVNANMCHNAFPDADRVGLVPGTRSAGPASYVYIEALRGETSVQHQRCLYRYSATYHKKVGDQLPIKGMLIAEHWSLKMPDGRVYYAYAYGGDKDRWLNLIHDFAKAEGRRTGEIIGGRMVSISDSDCIPVAACLFEKMSV